MPLANIQNDAYRRFHGRFKNYLENIIAESCEEFRRNFAFQLVDNLRDHITLKFIPQFAEAESNCTRFGCLDGDRIALIQLGIRLSSADSAKSIPLGYIPVPTADGTFILQGNEWQVLGQVIRSPGIHITKTSEKSFSASFIPYRGIWIEIKATGKGLSHVTIGRGPDNVLSWENFESIMDIGNHSSHAVELGKNLCRILRIPPKTMDFREIKERVQLRLFDENQLSLAGRYQVNRVLKCITRNDLPVANHLTREDMLGAARYLSMLCKGDPLPLQDPQSLAVNRVRLIDEVLEDKILVPFQLRFKRALKSRLDDLQSAGSINEDQWIQAIQDAALSGNKIFELAARAIIPGKGDYERDDSPSRQVPEESGLARNALFRRVTLLRPGLTSRHLSKDWRDIHWSHYGRLCPVDTPQSTSLGLTFSIPPEAKINKYGLIETPLRRVLWPETENTPSIKDQLIYRSAADEEDDPQWIAFHDEEENLRMGRKVLARRGPVECDRVEPRLVAFLDAHPLQPFSLAVRLIPFVKHNDANRCLMAASAMRQISVLKEPELPLLQTGYEKMASSEPEEPWRFGVNLLTAYMAYKGLNFEDAVVVSETGARKLTSVKLHCLDVRTPNLPRPDGSTVNLSLSPHVFQHEFQQSSLSAGGIIPKGAYVRPGDVLVGFADHELMHLCGPPSVSGALEPETPWRWDYSFRVPHGVCGEIKELEVLVTGNGPFPPGTKIARFTIEEERALEIGDKLSNRHGGKGVVSAIVADDQMPCFIDASGQHRPTEIILNPLGVLARLNVGQLYELHAGWMLHEKDNGSSMSVDPGRSGLELLKSLGYSTWPPSPGLEAGVLTLSLGKNGPSTRRPVAVGYTYIFKVTHMAADKLQARGYETKYRDRILRQPLQGKKLRGGQRLGEMELWALQAYSASDVLQEALTTRSDALVSADLAHLAQSIGKAVSAEPSIPESFRVLVCHLQALGLKLQCFDYKGETLDVFSDECTPDSIHQVSLVPFLAEESTSNIQENLLVSDPVILGQDGNFTSKGLFSEEIFGPLRDWHCKCGKSHFPLELDAQRCQTCRVPLGPSKLRRRRSGFILLPYPVFNVLFADAISMLLGVSRANLLNDVLCEGSSFHFQNLEDARWFLSCIDQKLHQRAERASLEEVNKILEKKFARESTITALNEFLRKLDANSKQELRRYLKIYRSLPARQVSARRLELLEALADSPVSLESTMISYLPVLPPELRPPYRRKNGSYSWGDINFLYQNLLRTLHRLEGTKRGVQKTQIRSVQRAVTALIDNSKAHPPLRKRLGRIPQQDLTGILSSKSGLIRRNLLGKRLDYSGRAVIVPDPALRFDFCGLPYKLAVTLFRPLLISRLHEIWPSMTEGAIQRRINATMLPQSRKNETVEKDYSLIQSILNRMGSKTPVLLNRQPTLHRLGCQAFFFKVNRHDCISLHPLVTAGFNADFDGDTMAVHRAIGEKALSEMQRLLATDNLFSPASGNLTLHLGLDVALGAYVATTAAAELDDLPCVTTDAGQGPLDKERLSHCLSALFAKSHGTAEELVGQITKITKLVFNAVTREGISLSVFDLHLYRETLKKSLALNGALEDMTKAYDHYLQKIIGQGKDNVATILRSGAHGKLSTLRQLVGSRGLIETLPGSTANHKTKLIVRSCLLEGMPTGEAFISCHGSRKTTLDKVLGTSVAGYLMRRFVEVTHAIRITGEDCFADHPSPISPQGLPLGASGVVWFEANENALPADAAQEALAIGVIRLALWTASDSSEPVFQEPFVGASLDTRQIEEFHGQHPKHALRGFALTRERTAEEISSILRGRTLCDPMTVDDKVTPFVDSCETGDSLAKHLLKTGTTLHIRSPILCRKASGLCQQCYGLEPSTSKMAPLGSAVGTLAAQSIGEPGTQLVLRTFHHGGVAGESAIGDDLKRLERLLSGGTGLHMAMNLMTRPIAGIEPTQMLQTLIDELSHIYQRNGIAISRQHLEVLLAGLFEKKPLREGESALPKMKGLRAATKDISGWLAGASFERTNAVLALSSLLGTSDPLTGLKERVLVAKKMSDP